MGVNLILSLVGLVICFGGIYFKRICAGMIGLIWGLLGAAAIVLITAGLWDFDDHILTIIIVGVAVAILSAIFDRLCIAVNGFLSSFAVILLLLLAISDNDLSPMLLLISGLIALVVAVFSFKIYDYSFVLLTAVTGAFIASVGLAGLIRGDNFEEVLYRLLRRGLGDVPVIPFGTIGLGICGFFVQLQRIKKKPGSPSGEGNKQQTELKTSIAKDDTVASVTKDWEQYKDGTKNENDTTIKKESGINWSELIRKEKKLLFIPVISFIIEWLALSLLYKTDLSYSLVTLLYYFSSSLALGTLVYICIKKDNSVALTYVGIHVVLSIIMMILQGAVYFRYLLYVLVRMPLYWLVLHYCTKWIQQKRLLPLMLPGIVVLTDFIVSLILISSGVIFSFLITGLMTYAVVFGLFKIIDGTNIFRAHTDESKDQCTQRAKFSSYSDNTEGQQPNGNRKKCSYCGKTVNNNDVFCTNCGRRIVNQ